MTLLGAKLIFGVKEIMVVGHIYRPYGHKSSMEKVDAMQKMMECANTKEV